MAKYTKELKSKNDVIKYYFQMYHFYKNNIGERSEFTGLIITQSLADSCFNRMLELMEEEWIWNKKEKSLLTKKEIQQ